MGGSQRRLALGTVQFGLAYGIANSTGQVGLDEARDILAEARAAGVDTLDTAVAYGSSEKMLGEVGTAGWRVVSKLPPLPADCSNTRGWVASSLVESLERLRVDSLHGLLLHRPADLLGPSGDELYASMVAARNEGRVRGIGVSIYDPSELDALTARFSFDIVQAPFNLVDRRLERSGWLARLKARGVEVHTRSAFLQGLLLMNAANLPPYFDRWQSLWQRWRQWLEANRLDPLQACLSFVLARSQVDRVVVGVDNIGHLRQIVAAAAHANAEPPAELMSEEADLVNPSRWPKR